jgi:hypothetical protein
MDTFTWILLLVGLVVLLWVFLMGDIMSTLALLVVAAILCFVLIYYGFVTVTDENNNLNIVFNPSPAPPVGTVGSGARAVSVDANAALAPQVSGPEVFYVSDNKFTYEEAEYVCKAYDSELATYIQVEQAYNSGAEWCGYGWSAGGIALFPTQQASWEARITNPDVKKREICGRPGVNGGYFDPKMKFGVNCYGIKPKEPIRPKVSDDNDRLIGMFKDQIDKLVVDPFAKKAWSKYNIVDTTTPTRGAAPVAPLPPTKESPIATTLSGLGTAVVGAVNVVLSAVTGVVKSVTG